MARGRDTREYQSVLAGFDTITDHLRVNRASQRSLTIAYKQKSWIQLGEEPGPDRLVEITLNRIERDVSEYYVFMTMLDDIVGMDLVVKEIEGIVNIIIMELDTHALHHHTKLTVRMVLLVSVFQKNCSS